MVFFNPIWFSLSVFPVGTLAFALLHIQGIETDVHCMSAQRCVTTCRPIPAPPNPFTPTPFCPSVNACSVWQTSPRHLHPPSPTGDPLRPPQTPLYRRPVRFCIAINVIMVSNCIQKHPSSTPPSGTSSKSFGDPIRWCLVAWPPAICV